MQISTVRPILDRMVTPLAQPFKIIISIVNAIISFIQWFFEAVLRSTKTQTAKEEFLDLSEQVSALLVEAFQDKPLNIIDEKDRCKKDLDRMSQQSVFVNNKKETPQKFLDFIEQQTKDQALLYFFSEQDFLNGVVAARNFKNFEIFLATCNAKQHIHIRKSQDAIVIERSQTNFATGPDVENLNRYFTVFASACIFKGKFTVRARLIPQPGIIKDAYTQKHIFFIPSISQISKPTQMK